MHYQVLAKSDRGAIITFGLAAADWDKARRSALKCLPFRPASLEVQKIEPRGYRRRP